MKSEVIKKTLSNGLRLIHVKNKNNNLIIKVTVEVGSQNETKENNGITHFLEHMIWQGTKNKTAEEIRLDMKEINANFNAFTCFKRTNHFVSGPRRHYEKMLKTLLDVIQNPLFDEKEIERERNVILDEYKRESDDPNQILTSVIYSSVFKDHSLGRSIIGTEENIKKFTKEQLIEYYTKYYVANNMLISIIGNIENPEELIKKYFILEEGVLDKVNLVIPTFTENKKIILSKSNSSNHVGLAFLTSSKNHKDTTVINIVDYLLDYGKDINLKSAVRHKQGLTYNISTSNRMFRETGILIIKTTSPIDKTDVVINTIFSEIKKLENIKVKELNFAKRKLITSIRSSSKWPIFIEEKENERELFGYIDTTEEEIKKIKQVSVVDIKRITKEYFNNYLTVIIKPKG
jgi:predicted Zn-dependent peptidase